MMLFAISGKLRKNQRGAVAVEFGLLGLVMIVLLLGVLQIGIAMQKYNAIRGVAADVARYAVVQYQAGNEISNAQLTAQALQIATQSPYNLGGDANLPDGGLQVSVATASDQRVAGATELTFQITTHLPSVLSFIGVNSLQVSHTRPIFVLDE